MKQKLIRATELAEFVYCSKAWHLKYLEGAEVSPVARELQAEAYEAGLHEPQMLRKTTPSLASNLRSDLVDAPSRLIRVEDPPESTPPDA
jgi:hypothetical protein